MWSNKLYVDYSVRTKVWLNDYFHTRATPYGKGSCSCLYRKRFSQQMIYTLLRYFRMNSIMKERRVMVSQDFYRIDSNYAKDRCSQNSANQVPHQINLLWVYLLINYMNIYYTVLWTFEKYETYLPIYRIVSFVFNIVTWVSLTKWYGFHCLQLLSRAYTFLIYWKYPLYHYYFRPFSSFHFSQHKQSTWEEKSIKH